MRRGRWVEGIGAVITQLGPRPGWVCVCVGPVFCPAPMDEMSTAVDVLCWVSTHYLKSFRR